jgi:hypothetical protein
MDYLMKREKSNILTKKNDRVDCSELFLTELIENLSI